MNEQHVKQRAFVSVLGNVVLALIGLTVALGSVEFLMRTFPNWIPPEIRVNPPARRVHAFIDETYDLRHSDGDLFYHMRGSIIPISPDHDKVIARIHMITDAHGFRNSPPEKATYRVVALGDSFTRASGSAFSWTQKLAESMGSDVLNLADVGFGPQDELKVLQQYGVKKQPQWVITAYFEGNDLYDAAAYEQATPFILLRFGRYIVDRSLEAWHETSQDGTQAKAALNFRYPIPLTINDNELEMAFFSYYISWLSADREAIKLSKNYHLTTETMLQMQELSKTSNAHFLLVYVPSKEHVYLPYLKNADILERVCTDVPRIGMDQEGYLQFMKERATPELTRQHMNDQAMLLADFAVEHHLFFLDLTKAFQEKAGAGAELYYPFDTHWNQIGHNLAAETIYKYIQTKLHGYRNENFVPN
jgi:hypothetical protein